ncbi:MAG: 3-hydroxyacyl-ACP dehydratase FabZ [Planctomycetaceae bacterium]|nr:3-hydroxyacyl-ACP dehydratase FabZ [Planctomycetaceae bacterium]
MPSLNKNQIQELIPHRDPFLWIDEIVEIGPNRIVARKFVDPALDVFRGHYPGKPVLPGVLMCEASMQAGAVLIARQTESVPAGMVPVAARINNVKFKHMVRPGDTLEIEVELTERLKDTYYMSAKVKAAGKTAATLDFACTAVPG